MHYISAGGIHHRLSSFAFRSRFRFLWQFCSSSSASLPLAIGGEKRIFAANAKFVRLNFQFLSEKFVIIFLALSCPAKKRSIKRSSRGGRIQIKEKKKMFCSTEWEGRRRRRNILSCVHGTAKGRKLGILNDSDGSASFHKFTVELLAKGRDRVTGRLLIWGFVM